MNGPESAALELVRDILEDGCQPSHVRACEEGAGWSEQVWNSLAGSDLPWVSVPEEFGGAGGTLSEALFISREVGRYAAPVPFVETGILAGWLLSQVGSTVARVPTTVPPGHANDTARLTKTTSGWRLEGVAHDVPWAACAQNVVALLGDGARWHVAAVPADRLEIHPGRNLAGEPRDDIVFRGVELDRSSVVPAPTGVNVATLKRRGALARAMQMAGAMEAVCRLTIRYSGARQQFGRPISSFQAVRHNLATVVGETELGSMAGAAAAAQGGDAVSELAAAIAKSMAGVSADKVARLGHQVHGAIGMTKEYDLQLSTRRLWAWESEFGSTRYWSSRLGSAVLGMGSSELWDLTRGRAQSPP